MSEFTFCSYSYDKAANKASFLYKNNGISFTETLEFSRAVDEYDERALDAALQLAFVLIGTSYYKTSPSQTVQFKNVEIDEWQAKFFDSVYQEGLSQFAYENNLTRENLASFTATKPSDVSSQPYKAVSRDPIVLQSGGKDSLLLASLLEANNVRYTPLYITSGSSHPAVLDSLNQELIVVRRTIDHAALGEAKEKSAFNGHVPVTYIVESIALIQAILLGRDTVLAAIGHEGEEPYGFIGDLPVAHQWAKTWQSELSLQEYLNNYVGSDLKIGSPLRKYSELKIAQLFAEKCWDKFSGQFSSCNIGNYKQGHDNKTLGWCGNCPKCANSFLLFAPFVDPVELQRVFNGENLFKKASLEETFKGLLGIDGAIKPFECIGEEAELRTAYHMAHQKFSEYELPFMVPAADFDYEQLYPLQEWAASIA